MEFFPANTLSARPERHEFRERWYVPHLLAMEERPLYPPTLDQPLVYRLLFLPTFRRPAVARLTEASGTWQVVCKRSDGLGGYSPGRLAGKLERELSRAEVKQFARALDRIDFWDMPSYDDSLGRDGSNAILEGARVGAYHVVDRWSPHGTPYAELVNFLLELCSGVGEPAPKPPKYVGSFAELAKQLRPRSDESGSGRSSVKGGEL
jgi:hypothetical protein